MDQTAVEETVAKIVDDTEMSMDIDDGDSGTLEIVEAPVGEENNVEEEPKEVAMDLEGEEEQNVEGEEESKEEEAAEEEKAEEEEEEVLTAEQIQRSLDLKNEFLELFDIAPKLRNILGEIKGFMSNSEVSKADRKEIQALVEKRMNDEKKAKKKAKLEEVAKSAAAPKPEVTTKNELAEAIKNVVGIDLSSLLANKPQQPAEQQVQVPMTMAPYNCMPAYQAPPGYAAPPQQFAPPPQPNAMPVIQPQMTVKYGKAGFGTPHPKEVPAIPEELKVYQKKPEEICPIPVGLQKKQVSDLNVAPLPNALLPAAFRKKEPVEFLGPPIRRTLWLAGARPLSSRKSREKENTDQQYTQDTIDADKFNLPAGVAPISDELMHPKEANAKKRRNREKADEYRTSLARREGANAMDASLHRDSPIAVKRYHARQLAKETGMSVEEALDEIEEQCREFKDRAVSPPRKAPIRRGRYDDGHVPIDHSRGIPGIDRPPVGYSGGGGGGDRDAPMAKRRRGGVKEREKQERRKNRWNDQDYGRGGGGGGRGGGRGGGGGRNRYQDDWGGRGGGGGGGYDDQYSRENYSQDSYGHDSYNQEGYDSQSGGGYEGYYEPNATGKYGETSAAGGGGGAQDNNYDGYYGYDNTSNDYSSGASHYYKHTAKSDSANYYQQNTGQDYPSTYHATYGKPDDGVDKGINETKY